MIEFLAALGIANSIVLAVVAATFWDPDLIEKYQALIAGMLAFAAGGFVIFAAHITIKHEKIKRTAELKEERTRNAVLISIQLQTIIRALKKIEKILYINKEIKYSSFREIFIILPTIEWQIKNNIQDDYILNREMWNIYLFANRTNYLISDKRDGGFNFSEKDKEMFDKLLRRCQALKERVDAIAADTPLPEWPADLVDDNH